jgi:hypothetical protein
MAALLIGYFLSMKIFDLHKISELRVLNGLIVGALILKAIWHVKKTDSSTGNNYLEGFGTGSLTSFIGITIFAIFLVIYLFFLDPGFMTYVQQNEPFGEYLNPLSVSFVILIEGMSSGVIMTFIMMQYLKENVEA